jgi:hypothetical protein
MVTYDENGNEIKYKTDRENRILHLRHMALLCKERNDIIGMLKYLEEAITIYDDPVAMYLLGEYFEENSDIAKAMHYYMSAFAKGYRPALDKINNLYALQQKMNIYNVYNQI